MLKTAHCKCNAKSINQKDKNTNIQYILAVSSPRVIRSRVIIVRGARQTISVVVANVRTVDRNRRALARRNVSGLSALSLERALRPSCRPPYCSVQLIMPIDRVGIGPARPCMLMCERTSVSPLRVSASGTQP